MTAEKDCHCESVATKQSPSGYEKLPRLIAGQGHPVHDPAEAVVIVDRVVLGAAIVPEGERADLPAEAAGEFRPGLLREQEAQQRRALLLGHSLEAQRVAAIDVERLPPGLGMGAH